MKNKRHPTHKATDGKGGKMSEGSALAPYTGDAVAAIERAESLQLRVNELEKENRQLCEEIELATSASVQKQEKPRRWWRFWWREDKEVSQEEIEKLIEEKNKIISARENNERVKQCVDFLSWLKIQNGKIPKAKSEKYITLYEYQNFSVGCIPGENFIRSSLEKGWEHKELVDKLIVDEIDLDEFEREVKKKFFAHIKSI